ncbi:uncharacterized protein LOC117120561 [Anneissia japonica]|uniref:uncharacterized protein LOC117120561 n=1 Tax=Anneissia japonica TaxID=1529436 RepID=UPI001425589E|nr:uncharacterized protein LOC117120561 [Anneissia japonica]
MFGRHPRLPIDIILGLDKQNNGSSTTVTKYASDMQNRLEDAYKRAAAQAIKSTSANKEAYDRKARDSALQINDRVLVRSLGFKGAHKLSDRWGKTTYKVVKRVSPDIPVYVVRPDVIKGPERTLHRNHLLPILSLPLDDNQPPQPHATRVHDSNKLSTSGLSDRPKPAPRPVSSPRIPVPAPRRYPVPAPRQPSPAPPVPVPDSSNSDPSDIPPVPRPRRTTKPPVRFSYAMSESSSNSCNDANLLFKLLEDASREAERNASLRRMILQTFA